MPATRSPACPGRAGFGTSIAIANAIDPNPQLVLAATGMNFPDALGAGAAAGSFDARNGGIKAVVVLTTDANLSPETTSYLDTWAATNAGRDDVALFSVGTQAQAALDTRYGFELALSGHGRYETASLVANTFFFGEQAAGLAVGDNWPDALSGGALLGSINAPLVTTPSTGALDVNTAYTLDINSASISTALVFGKVVPAAAQATAGKWISGSAGYDGTAPAVAHTASAQARGIATVDVAPSAKPTIEQLKARAAAVAQSY